MVCKNICESYKAKKPVGGMRYLAGQSAARAVTFSSTGRASDVHAVQQSYELAQGVEA